MKGKKYIARVLALILLWTLWSIPAEAAGSDYDTELTGVLDKSSGNMYFVDFKVKTNNGALIQGFECTIAYDTSVFELASADGSKSLSEAGFSVAPGAYMELVPDLLLYDFVTYPGGWSPLLSIALSADSKTGFVSMQGFRMSAVPVNSQTTLQRIFLRFKNGKSLADVSDESIKFITLPDMLLFKKDSQVQIFDGSSAAFEYERANGGQNTLKKPIFTIEKGVMVNYNITASAGTGGSVTGGGIYSEGSFATLTATPKSGYTFSGWYENNVKIPSASAVYTFVVTGNRVLEAKFEELLPGTYEINLKAGSGGTVSGGGSFTEGTSITVSAKADDEYCFDYWIENGSVVAGAGADYTFTVNGNRELEAVFKLLPKYTITAVAGENGSVSGGGVYSEGTIVNLKAIPAPYFSFLGWFENDIKVVGAGAAYSFAVKSDRTLEARFAESTDVMVYSTSHAEAYINLSEEAIFLPPGTKVESYSINGGIRWKKGPLPEEDKINRLFNKELTLFIATELDEKKKPTGVFIKFPTIQARPKANLERLAPFYGEDSWDLAVKKTGEMPEEIYEYLKSPDGKKMPSGSDWIPVIEGICDIEIEQPKTKTLYFFRTPATGDGSDGDPFTPPSKIFKVKPKAFMKTPKHKIDEKKNIIKLKKNDFYIIGNGEEKISPGAGSIDISELAKGTVITIWKGETGKKPPSLRINIKI